MKRNNPKGRTQPNQQPDVQRLDAKNEINIQNSGAAQPHNAGKEAMGPNTKR